MFLFVRIRGFDHKNTKSLAHKQKYLGKNAPF